MDDHKHFQIRCGKYRLFLEAHDDMEAAAQAVISIALREKTATVFDKYLTVREVDNDDDPGLIVKVGDALEYGSKMLHGQKLRWGSELAE